ncbi:MAG: hypothetical protein HON32_00515 [Francisellaceae bacterium]|jgi:hypothetical protein|nr:hypothetical protein [Francisellaceae bacterium]MBT6538977.1 hypothetical protein [Francisellaceae bacterium]
MMSSSKKDSAAVAKRTVQSSLSGAAESKPQTEKLFLSKTTKKIILSNVKGSLLNAAAASYNDSSRVNFTSKDQSNSHLSSSGADVRHEPFARGSDEVIEKDLSLTRRGMTLYFHSLTPEVDFNMQDIMAAISRCEIGPGIHKFKFGQCSASNGKFKKEKITPILNSALLIEKRNLIELCDHLNIDYDFIKGPSADEWRDVIRWYYNDLQLSTDFDIPTQQKQWMIEGTRRIHVINPNDIQLAKESRMSISKTNRKAQIDVHQTREFHSALEVMEGIPHTYLRHAEDNPVVVTTRSAFNAALSKCLPGTTLIIDGHWDGDDCDPAMYASMGIWGKKTVRAHAQILAEEINCTNSKIDHVILGACFTGVVNKSITLNERQVSFKSESIEYNARRMMHMFPLLSHFKERATFETSVANDQPFEKGSLAGLFILALQRYNIFTVAVTASPQVINLVSPEIHGHLQAKEIGFIGQPLRTVQQSLGTSAWLSEPKPWDDIGFSLNERLTRTKSITWVFEHATKKKKCLYDEAKSTPPPHRKSSWQRRLLL